MNRTVIGVVVVAGLLGLIIGIPGVTRSGASCNDGASSLHQKVSESPGILFGNWGPSITTLKFENVVTESSLENGYQCSATIYEDPATFVQKSGVRANIHPQPFQVRVQYTVKNMEDGKFWWQIVGAQPLS